MIDRSAPPRLSPFDSVQAFCAALRDELAGGNGREPSAADLRRYYRRLLLADWDAGPSGAGRYASRLLPLVEAARGAAGQVTALDCGCGFGTESLLLGLEGVAVTGVDAVPERVEVARARVPFYERRAGRPLGVRFASADILRYLEGVPRVDLIWALEAISHIHPLEDFLTLAFDRLSPGGLLVTSDPNALNPLARYRGVPDSRDARAPDPREGRRPGRGHACRRGGRAHLPRRRLCEEGHAGGLSRGTNRDVRVPGRIADPGAMASQRGNLPCSGRDPARAAARAGRAACGDELHRRGAQGRRDRRRTRVGLMRVLIVNTCSTLNRGDAAIVLGQIRLLERWWPGARVALTSKTPATDEAFYGPLGVEVLPPLTPALSTFAGPAAKLAGGARALLDGRGRRRLVELAVQSDIILSCGGGYFYSYRRFVPGTTFWQNVVHANLAARTGKPLVFLPQSFGPLRSAAARRAVGGLVNAEPVVRAFAREQGSVECLRQLVAPARQHRIALCPDMAFYLRGGTGPLPVPTPPTRSAGPALAVNLREWAFPDCRSPADRRARREAYLNALTSAAAWFVERHRGRVIVIPQALGPDPAEDDRAICSAFVERARARVHEPGLVQFVNPGTASLSEYLQILSQVTLLVGTRLHACLLAMLAGVPAISIGTSRRARGRWPCWDSIA